MVSRKRSLSDMQRSASPSKVFDEEAYRTTVLQLPATVSEDEADQSMTSEAQELGLLFSQPSAHLDGLASSLSATTIGSDTNKQSSVLSQSTGPTSCSSSCHRPVTQSSMSHKPQLSPIDPIAPSLASENEKRKGLGFRNGFRRMTGFKKRRSLIATPSILSSIDGNSMNVNNGDSMSIKSGMKTPPSIKSSKSSWSNPPSAIRPHYEDLPQPEDKDAIRRTRECKELMGLHLRQMEERSRFAEFQKTCISQLRVHHQSEKQHLIEAQQQRITDTADKNEKSIEDLESRHLEAEMKLVDEFELAKRTILVRLRHMEAYVQNPTPPPTPQTSTSSRNSDEQSLPERKITDKDYHNLAQQYRERDAMETLHKSKIEVMRGKQNKALEIFITKKGKELSVMRDEHANAIKFAGQLEAQDEEALTETFNEKKRRIEERWKLQASIERAKMEKTTGVRYGPLPDVVISKEDKSCSIHSATAA